MWKVLLVLFFVILIVHADSVHIEKIHENFITSKDTYIFDQQNRLKQVSIVATKENAEISYVKNLFSSTFGKDHIQEFFCSEKHFDSCLQQRNSKLELPSLSIIYYQGTVPSTFEEASTSTVMNFISKESTSSIFSDAPANNGTDPEDYIPTDLEIADWQTSFWTAVMLIALVLVAINMMLNIDYSKDTFYYAAETSSSH